MNQRLRTTLAAAWVVSLGASWWAGHRMAMGWNQTRQEAAIVHDKAQADCLRRMWGPRPFVLEALDLQEVRAIEADPEAFRAFLLNLANRNVATLRQSDLPGSRPGARLDYRDMDTYLDLRAKRLLELWVPGQGDIQRTVNPEEAGRSPQWLLYLTDPQGAFLRGVSARGYGGK